LTSPEAVSRLAANGPNRLEEGTRIHGWKIFLAQFKSLLIWVLLAAGIVSGALGQLVDAFAILAIVLLNAVIGFYQEFSAEKSIDALRKLTAPRAKVRRDGKVILVPAVAIVTGDVLALEAGDLVAADARLLHTASLKCVESALTGEADAVTKHSTVLGHDNVPLGDRTNMVFMGTSVATGTAQAVVVATGMNSELGRIASLLSKARSDGMTPLQHHLNSFARSLVWVTLGIIGVLSALGFLRGTPPVELLLTAISLAVAAVPEGLPAVVTVALALGVSRMARQRALVRKLAAVETLGSTNVICTDKTGTLTVGNMTVRKLHVAGQTYDVTGEGYGPEGAVQVDGKPTEARHAAPLLELARVMLACNDAHLIQEKGSWIVIGDPTEGALLAAATKAGGNHEHIEKSLPRHAAIPFDSTRKRSSMVRRLPDGSLCCFTNGAPGPLLKRCLHILAQDGIRPLTDSDRSLILAQTSSMAANALRVLGSAYRILKTPSPTDLSPETVEREMVFVGLAGMYDPPRPEARVAVARCRAAGIRVVMITGDHPETASAIAHELGIASRQVSAVTGLHLDTLSETQLRKQVEHIPVYARVTAEHKLRIVLAWKSRGAVVAMTGDGVNDAPAIQGADIGIAMGKSGTEVTRQAADIIITDDNFSTLVAAIEQGRGIYDNIRKTLQYLLAGNVGELLLMTVCVVIGLPAPLLPIHLLWINLVTDGLPALCLATDPIDSDLLHRPPRPRSERITNPRFLRTMLLTGVLTAGVAFFVYRQMLQHGSIESARTAAFAVLVFAELLRSFGARSETRFVWRISPLSNPRLLFVVVTSIAFQMFSQHNDWIANLLKTSFLPLSSYLILLALGAIPLAVLEMVKVARHLRQPTPPPTTTLRVPPDSAQLSPTPLHRNKHRA
jgi:Ca2+-transporting ATPase